MNNGYFMFFFYFLYWTVDFRNNGEIVVDHVNAVEGSAAIRTNFTVGQATNTYDMSTFLPFKSFWIFQQAKAACQSEVVS
jgi:hypothetical protein